MATKSAVFDLFKSQFAMRFVNYWSMCEKEPQIETSIGGMSATVICLSINNLSLCQSGCNCFWDRLAWSKISEIPKFQIFVVYFLALLLGVETTIS